MSKFAVLAVAFALNVFAPASFANGPNLCELQIQKILAKIVKHGGSPIVSYEKSRFTSVHSEDETEYWCGSWRVRALLQNGIKCDATGYITECHPNAY